MKDGQMQDISMEHREFWCRGYYVDTVGKNTKRIKELYSESTKRRSEREQLTLDLEDPFKQEKGKLINTECTRYRRHKAMP